MIDTITLKNGVRIVAEKVDGVRSCCLGIWCESGSRHEPEELGGISHFIEHMLFKGTDTMTAAQLAEEFDAIGGGVNAFTTKENTCYYVRTLDEYLEKGAELLCDMFFSSTFKKEDVDLERGVIIEEIGMYEDSPEDVANELISAAIYNGYSLARPILGTRETLQTIDSKVLTDYYKKSYTPSGTLISISGSFSAESLEKIIAVFEKMEGGNKPACPTAEYQPSVVVKQRDTEQNHIYITFPGFPQGSEHRYTLNIMNNILGGGMSSRLFQTVREQNGLCYSIYSFISAANGTGVFGVYTATNKGTEMQAVELICNECRRLCRDGVSEDELTRSRQQIKASVLMGLENTATRMTGNAKNQLILGRQLTAEEISESYDGVTAQDVQDLACKIFDFSRVSLGAVGKVDTVEGYKKAIG